MYGRAGKAVCPHWTNIIQNSHNESLHIMCFVRSNMYHFPYNICMGFHRTNVAHTQGSSIGLKLLVESRLSDPLWLKVP